MKFLLEFGPVLAFFVVYKLNGLMAATAVLIAATALAAAITYIKDKRVPGMMLFTAGIVGIFGGLTLWLNDETFIKLKPTIINSLFALILLGGVAMKKGLIGFVLGEVMPLTDKGWIVLSRNYGIFFLGLALLNEYIWRNYSTDFWVGFKVWGMLSITMIFTISQMMWIQKYAVESE